MEGLELLLELTERKEFLMQLEQKEKVLEESISEAEKRLQKCMQKLELESSCGCRKSRENRSCRQPESRRRAEKRTGTAKEGGRAGRRDP